MLHVQNITVQYGSLAIVNDVSFQVREGQWMMVVGPNGAGKSSLLGAVTGRLSCTGFALFCGTEIGKMSALERAKSLGVVLQHHHVGYSFTVEEIVQLGRYAWSQGMFAGSSEEDRQMVTHALELTGLTQLRKQSVLTLSGGELQRTFLAQALAQNPRMLLLDEPTNHLDLVYQKQVFQLICEWLKEPGHAVVSVVHDLSLAKAFGSHALLMDDGKTVACGCMDEVLTGSILSDVYHMDIPQWMHNMLAQW